MHPAPSIILFTTLSGVGYGLLGWLGVFAALGVAPLDRLFGVGSLVVALGLITIGLMSSTLHLGHPGDHGQTRVEVEGDGACPALDDESFELHGRGIGRRGPDLESNGPLGRRGGG